MCFYEVLAPYYYQVQHHAIGMAWFMAAGLQPKQSLQQHGSADVLSPCCDGEGR